MPPEDSLDPFREAARAFSELRADGARPPEPPHRPSVHIPNEPGEPDEPDPPPALPPEYRIEQCIAETRLSRTWRAFHTEHQAHVVVKELHPRLLLEHDALDRFRVEVQLISKFAHLAHRNIVPILATHLSEPPYFFTMPLIEGEHLDRYCAERRLDLRARVRLFIRVCRGVAHAHRSGVIHRDLKPNNIIVDRDGEPQLLDFGLARAQLDGDAETAPRRGPIYGALAYMAPEQTQGLPGDAATDIYALGGILHELLTGRRAIELTASVADCIDRIRTARPTPLRALAADVSPELEAIVLRCLEKQPAHRYPTVAELTADLEHWLSDRPISLWRTRGAYVLGKFLRRNRVAFGLGAVVAAGLITLLAIEVSRQQHVALTRVKAETERHMRAIAHARLLTSRAAPAAAATLIRQELSTHDDLRTRYALWELHRQYPCIANVATPRRPLDVAFDGDDGVVVLDESGTLNAWSYATGIWTTLWFPFAATCIAPGDCEAAFYVGAADGAIYAVTAPASATLPTASRTIVPPGDSRPLACIAVEPRIRRCALASSSGRLQIVATRPGEEPSLVLDSRDFDRITALTFSPAGELLAAAGQPSGALPASGRVQVFNAATGTTCHAHAAGQVRSIAFGPDDTTVYVGDESVWVWRLNSDTVAPLWEGLKWGVRSIVSSTAAPYPWLAAASGDGRIQFGGLAELGIWPVGGFHETAVADRVRLATSRDGLRVASVAADGLRIWDLHPARRTPTAPDERIAWAPARVLIDESGDRIVSVSNLRAATPPGVPEACVRCVHAGDSMRVLQRGYTSFPFEASALSGTRLLSADGDGIRREHSITIIDLNTPDQPEFFAALPTDARTVQWRDAARGSALAGLSDGRIVELEPDLARGQLRIRSVLIAFEPGQPCNSIAVSANREWLAAASDDARRVRLWRLATGPIERATLVSAATIAFTPWQVAVVGAAEQPRLVLSGASQHALVLDGRTGHVYGALVGHRDSIDQCVALSPEVVITASRDGSVIAWDVANLEELSVLHTGDQLPRIDAAGERVAIATSGGVTVCDLRESQTSALVAAPRGAPRE